MSERGGTPPRAGLLDLFRPERLFASLQARPFFVLPTLVLCGTGLVYALLALRPAVPIVVPRLLENATATESELTGAFRRMVLTIAVGFPMLFVVATAAATWALLRIARSGRPFLLVLSLVAHASLWAGLGLLAKGLLVLATGLPDPPVNLGLLLERATREQRLLLAFTNPFLLLAAAWTVRGLRAFGARGGTAALAGAGPWVVWIGFSVLGSAGGGSRFAPSGPVSYEGWETIETETLLLRHPPELAREARELAELADRFARRLGERFGFEPRRIRVDLFADHRQLERAAGEFLHVQVVGSIRGRDVLFLEMPGHNAAVPRARGMREALRYVALMHLALVPGLRESPRWLVEALAHAAAVPWSPHLEREYRSLLRRRGIPNLEPMLVPTTYQTPEGPLLARALLDDFVARHGRAALDGLLEDLASGTSFRDALYARARLTVSALEEGWREGARALLAEAGRGEAPRLPAAPADSASGAEPVPFPPRR